jgi:hypothetical protein
VNTLGQYARAVRYIFPSPGERFSATRALSFLHHTLHQVDPSASFDCALWPLSLCVCVVITHWRNKVVRLCSFVGVNSTRRLLEKHALQRARVRQARTGDEILTGLSKKKGAPYREGAPFPWEAEWNRAKREKFLGC